MEKPNDEKQGKSFHSELFLCHQLCVSLLLPFFLQCSSIMFTVHEFHIQPCISISISIYRDYKLNDHHLPSSQGTSLPHYKFIYVITVASVFSLELLGGEISSCFTLHQCFPEKKILTIIEFNQHLLQKSTTEKRTGVSFRTWSRTVMNVGQMHQFNRIFMMLLDQDFTIEDLAKRDRHNNASPNCTRAWKTGLH